MSDKFAIAKMVVNLAAGVGTSKVVNDVINNNVTVETTADAAKVWIGSAVIGSMVADKASEHVNTKLEKVADWWETRRAAKDNAEVVS